MLAVRTPGAPLGHSHSVAACDSAFPFEGQGRLLRSRSISGLFSRSLYSGLQPPCLRFAVALTGHHARLASRLLARLYRGRHLRRQSSTHLHGATRTDPDVHLDAYGSYLGCLTAKFAVCVPAPVTHFPGTEPGACFADPHFPWSPSLAPLTPRRIAPRCSPASQLLFRGPTSRLRTSSAMVPHLPDADQGRALPLAKRGISQLPVYSFCT
jgi:hypothetical protein